MAEFVPFKAYRPVIGSGDSIGNLVSPPIDCIPDDMLAQLKETPRNVVNLTLVHDADGHYKGASERLRAMIADGSLRQDIPSFYIYEQEFGFEGKRLRRRAVVGLLRIEEYSSGVVLPHESVYQKLWKDRQANIADTGADLESILGVYEGDDIQASKEVGASERLLYRYTDPEGTEHRFMGISDPDVCRAITQHIKDRRVLIADGHHRYEAALQQSRSASSEKEKYVMCALVSSENGGLAIGASHRIIDAEDIGETSAIKKLSKRTAMTETAPEELKASLKDHAAGIVFRSGRCFFSDPLEPNGEPGAVFAEREIVNGIYKSDEGKSHVTVSTDTDSAVKSVADKQHDLVVLLNPPEFGQIMELAAKGQKMPKKSTWFYPKIWSGWAFYVFRRFREC